MHRINETLHLDLKLALALQFGYQRGFYDEAKTNSYWIVPNGSVYDAFAHCGSLMFSDGDGDYIVPDFYNSRDEVHWVIENVCKEFNRQTFLDIFDAVLFDSLTPMAKAHLVHTREGRKRDWMKEQFVFAPPFYFAKALFLYMGGTWVAEWDTLAPPIDK